MNGRDSEGLIVHEYSHIYFYGIVANNEVNDAWLDEGFTTMQTTHYMMTRYGDHGFDTDLYEGYDKLPKRLWPLENDLHSDQWRAIRFMRSGYDENISRPSYLFNNGSAYSNNAYTKPSLMLFELSPFQGCPIFLDIYFLESVLSKIGATNQTNHLGISFFGKGYLLPNFSLRIFARDSKDIVLLNIKYLPLAFLLKAAFKCASATSSISTIPNSTGGAPDFIAPFPS